MAYILTENQTACWHKSMYNVPSRRELTISTLETTSPPPASRGQAPKLAVYSNCPPELQFLNDLTIFHCLNKLLSILCFISVSAPPALIPGWLVVSACTEGMAQLLLQQLLNQHKLQLTVLKYVEIGVYLRTWGCKPRWFSSCLTNSWANPAARVKMRKTARMTTTALG